MKRLFLLGIFCCHCFVSVALLGHENRNETKNKIVLVTGASRGIGYAISELLANEGYIVYAGCRNPYTNENLIKSQHHHPHTFFAIELDVTAQPSVDKAVKKIIDNEGHLDILVNNAGIMTYGSIENITIHEAQNIFDVNFFGVMRVTQTVLPFMREQMHGRIIQISSRSGFRPLPSISVYAASKFALEGISETMAATLKPWNIKVSLIEPGPVKTDLDFTSSYGSRLSKEQDPYFELFEVAGLLDPVSPLAQESVEIAQLVKLVIEVDKPHLRYQTTKAISEQAGKRFCDVTGDSSVNEWEKILYQPN